jgi:hypothetical protein
MVKCSRAALWLKFSGGSQAVIVRFAIWGLQIFGFLAAPLFAPGLASCNRLSTIINHQSSIINHQSTALTGIF